MKMGTADIGTNLGAINRRSVLKGMGGLGLAAASSSFLAARGASAAESLNYMCWEGYNAPSILEPFQKGKDASISIDLITDSAGGFAKLAAGASRDFDLVSSDSPWIQRMGPAGFCRFIDDADFADQYADFYPQFRAPFEPLQFEGKATGLPTRWGWVGPTVNTKFDKLETWTSYAPVFDAAYKDKICLLDWGDWPIMPLALYAGVNPYEALDQAALDEVRKVLRAAFKNTRAIVADLAIAQKGLLDGSFRALIGGGTYCTSSLRIQGHDYIQSIVPEPKNGLKQGIIWMEGDRSHRQRQELADRGGLPEIHRVARGRQATGDHRSHLQPRAQQQGRGAVFRRGKEGLADGLHVDGLGQQPVPHGGAEHR